MAKKKEDDRHREIKQNVTYHVFSRCINSQKLMGNPFFKELFLESIKLTQEKYDFHLLNYIILDNHFHLIIKTLPHGATISRIMQLLKSNFARKYNRIMNRTGPFWDSRYGDKIIENSVDPEEYCLYLQWYCAFNSVRHKLVVDPCKYAFSGIMHYLVENYKSQLTITLSEYFINLGKTFQDRVQAFLKYEDMYRKRNFKPLFDF